MRLTFLFLSILPFLGASQTIVILNDDFGSGCDADFQVTSYTPVTGNWTVTNTGTNTATANIWYVSAAENGNAAGQCGTGCGNDRTLHIGSHPNVLGDIGAAYYEGLAALCGILDCGATDKRVESPVLNCLGLSGITVSFLYLEGGNIGDNATLWYFNGTVWSQLADMAKTVGSCAPQGTWTSYSITLPQTADENANVKIGFRWVNNDNGVASDPSIAIDDFVVTGQALVTDVTAPNMFCPPELIVGCGPLPDLTSSVTVTDDIDPLPLVTQLPPPGTLISGGPIPLTFFATDASGNQSSCMPLVTFSDLIPPTISCPPPVTIQVGQGSADIQIPPATIGVPIANDDCFLPTVTNDHPSEYFPVGTTIITWTATDGAGNTASCTQEIHVVEDQDPVIFCNQQINIECGTLPDLTYLALVSDDNDPSPILTQIPAAGTDNLGITQVTIIATDDQGNSSMCQMAVSVYDNNNPVILCPDNVFFSVPDGITETALTAGQIGFPFVSDNCGVESISWSYVSNTFPLGETETVWTVSDFYGNSSSCTQTVSILADVSPVILCPGILSNVAAEPVCTPSMTIGCADDLIDKVIIRTVQGVELMNTGNTGCNGAIGSYEEIAPVNGITSCNLIEGETYEISVHSDILFNEYLSIWIDYNDDGDFLDDNEHVGSNPIAAIIVSYFFTVPIFGNNYGQYRMRIICDFSNTIQPNEQCLNSTWGESEDYLLNIVSADLNDICGYLPDFVPLASVADDLDPSPTVIQTPAPGTFFTDDIEVTLTATDNAGHESSCSFMVTYSDTESPTISCPTNLLLNTDVGICTAELAEGALGIPMTDDNCGVQSVENDNESLVFNLGTNEVLWTVTDHVGNTNTCIQTIEVVDAEPLFIQCPDDISVTTAIGSVEAEVTIPLPMVIENCGVYTLSNDFTDIEVASGIYPVGITNVLYTATGNADETVSCSIQVEVSVQELICCPGDFNCDGYISVLDLLILMADFGCTSGCVASLDGNSYVSTTDLQIFMGLYGTICD